MNQQYSLLALLLVLTAAAMGSAIWMGLHPRASRSGTGVPPVRH